MEYDVKKLNLDMLRNVWECDAGKMGNIRTNILINDHFNKKSYSRMRVYLAVQVVSSSMVKLIDDHADICGGRDNYKSLKLMVSKIDRLVDIMNNADVSNRGERKGYEILDSPHHIHIQELLDILIFFCKWKDEVGNDINKYITWQSHDDLLWLILSTIRLAQTSDKCRRLCQRRSGIDDCEHEFAGTKLRNPKPTQNHMRKHTTRRTGTRKSGMFTKLNKANTSRDQVLYTDDLIKPI